MKNIFVQDWYLGGAVVSPDGHFSHILNPSTNLYLH